MTYLYIAITLVCWASAFVAIRIAVEDFSPGSLVLLRFLVCAAIVSAVVVPRHGVARFFRLSRGDLGRLVLMAVSGAVLYTLLLAQGQRTVSAFGASLLINTVPIWTAMLAGLLLRERLDRLAWAGAVVAFAGAILVGSSDGGFSLEFGGAVSVLLAAACQAIYFVALRSVVVRVGADRATALTFLFATIAALPFAGSLVRDLAVASPSATAAVVYLGVVPGGVGVWSWARAAERLPASRQAIFLYFVPPLAALMAWAAIGEVPGWGMVLGGVVTVAGVAIVNWPRSWLRSGAPPLPQPVRAGERTAAKA